MLFTINALSKGMIFFYPELIENRGGISILHHFKERIMFIVRRAFFCAKIRPHFLFNTAQR
jgi:hypothetical protein